MTGMVNAELTTPLNWREERRRDRLTAAQIGTQARIAEAEASVKMRRDKHQARHADRRMARRQRTARRAEQAAWLRAHVVDLLFVPVIVVPGVLAWTAMAAYGRHVWGPAGVILPVFSEGAMWAFAGATTLSLRRHPERPLWHLRAGTAVFAAVGATLNFIHGLTAQGVAGGIGAGVVMALVSVAGVVAHQLITAGPRRTRAERDAARARWAVTRRERVIERTARRAAVAELDADGNARLIHQPATVTLTRHWHGRVSLDDVASPGGAPLQVSPWPRPVPVLGADAPAQSAPRSAPATASQAHPEEARSGAPGQRPAGAPASTPKAAPNRRSGRTLKGVTDAAAERHFAADLTAGKVPSERQIKRELHVGQDRAKAIRDHLAQCTPHGRVVVPMERRA